MKKLSESVEMEMSRAEPNKAYLKVQVERLRGWMEKARKLEKSQPTSKRADDISYRWGDGSVCFDCPCGMKDIVTDPEDEPFVCNCGRVYRVSHFVTVEAKDE